MRQRKSGVIVNTSSVAGIRAGAGGNAYSASKAALINFTQTAACDLGADNIRVNAVCPGLIETGMTKPVFDYARQSGKEHKLGSRCELRRYGKPEEIACAILFFASDESSYITGQALAVDGGNSASLNLPGMKV
jgi:meso-butanediol dehydrogenase / (S,S)-butanediol dehydrogenase / diacetyl reductase